MTKIYLLIRRLGISAKYKGYFYLAESVRIALENNEPVTHITKTIYPEVAYKYNTSPANVEHAIRTVIKICWDHNKEALMKISYQYLTYKPTNSEFIDILAFYLKIH